VHTEQRRQDTITSYAPRLEVEVRQYCTGKLGNEEPTVRAVAINSAGVQSEGDTRAEHIARRKKEGRRTSGSGCCSAIAATARRSAAGRGERVGEAESGGGWGGLVAEACASSVGRIKIKEGRVE
jgi:hypothetical protein